MSGDQRASDRKTLRFDYSKYNTKGDKVPLATPESGLTEAPLVSSLGISVEGPPSGKGPVGTTTKISIMDQNLDKAEGLRRKIERCMSENDVDDLFDISDIQEAINELRSLMDKYEDVHVGLKRELADQYSVQFPDYDSKMAEMTGWIKNAKKAIKEKKEAAAKQIPDQVGKTRLRLVAEEKLLREKINDEIETFELEDSFFIMDIEKNVDTIDRYSREYSNLFVKIEEMGEEFVNIFSDKFQNQCDKMNKFIRFMRKRIQEVRVAEQKLSFQQQKEEEEAKFVTEKKAKINACESLFENVSERICLLNQKCIGDLKKETDSSILDLKKCVKNLDSEFNDILDRIAELGKSYPSQYSETSYMMDDLAGAKIDLKNSLDKFKTNLEREILTRDLSEEKMKNASLIGIKLPKFKGYNSSLDFYTFKTEFETKVAPRLSAKLLPDYLKNNYLEGQAFQIVKELTDMAQIWERLKQSFGNVTSMLSKKLGELERGEALCRIKDDEKFVLSATKFKNCMDELSTLAEKHGVKSELYHMSTLTKVFQLIGKDRQRKIMQNSHNTFTGHVDNEQMWLNVVNHLNREIQVREQIIMFNGPSLPSNSDLSRGKGKTEEDSGSKNDSTYVTKPQSKPCAICGDENHVPTVSDKGLVVVDYFACDKFAKADTKERFMILRKKKLCFQCLSPGKKGGHDGPCFDKFRCPHDSHKTHERGLHILICDKHKEEDENKKLLADYKTKFITFPSNSHKDFSKNISLHSSHNAFDDSVDERSIYLLQKIMIACHVLNLMYDNGCGDACFSKRAIDILTSLGRATCTLPGPLLLEGVSGLTTVSKHGRYKVSLPLHTGEEIELEGLCVDNVTSAFPGYPLEEVENDLRAFAATKGNVTDLPKLPTDVGGETDIMIGSQYLKYYPKSLLMLPNGLTLYESQFLSSDGSRGVVCGPHKSFSDFHRRQGSHVSMGAYFSEQVLAYKSYCKLSSEFTLLSDFGRDDSMHVYPSLPLVVRDQNYDEEVVTKNDDVKMSEISYIFHYLAGKPKRLSKFETVEASGTEISYRCVDCRGCKTCLKSGKVEATSVYEEVEQNLIIKCVWVLLEKGYTICRLPFICDPVSRLAPNYHIARKIYNAQLKKLNSNPKSKLDVILAEKKLSDMGFVAFVDDLNVDQQNKINNSKVKYHLPWRPVQNDNSVTTPTRMVFDASQPTSSGFSLNDTLAKGTNNMNPMLMIVARWLIRRFAFHMDVQKMYNTVRLCEDDWAYQLYLWDDELNPENEPRLKSVLTVIYGVKPSGNLAERGLRETARLQKDEYPRVNEIVQNDVYVDDCLSGEDSARARDKVTDQMSVVVAKGGFKFKGPTYSGCDPPDDLKFPDNSINVAGLKWFSKSDLLGLKIGEMKFGKKSKSRKSRKNTPVIPGSFTRVDCAGRVGEIFDLMGWCTPIVAGFKLDLNVLSKRKLHWDDYVPEELIDEWKNNFDLISDLGKLRFKRLIVPEDAVDLKMDTIEISDASLKLACAAVYGRFRKKDGTFSCQLIFARSKIIPDGFNIPRAELIAAVLNATTGHIIYLSLDQFITDRIHLVDNQIVLFWINNRKSELKQWPRNRVIEATRLSDRKAWFYVDSKNNPADLGTRKGAKISDISEGSVWMNGFDWMREERSEFPVKSVDDLKLSDDELKDYQAELNDLMDEEWISQLSKSCSHLTYCYTALPEGAAEEIKKRYTFSDYIVDPNKFRFRKVVRIVGLLFLFISKLKNMKNKKLHTTVVDSNLPKQFRFSNDQCLVTQGKYGHPFVCEKGLTVMLTEKYLLLALDYFFKKGTLEVKKFLPNKVYKNLSEEKNGVLYYTGRILPSQAVDNTLQLADVCVDLTSSTFCVPVLDKNSPISFSIINEVHWYDDDAKHSGNETVWRHIQLIAFILEGKPLVKTFRVECPRCRYLRKRALEVAMGPVSDDHLRIAPPFYACQVDICGSFTSYSNVNKRASIKIWFVVFCCCVTGSVDIKVMENYSTTSFLLAFSRFSFKVGYPFKLLPDAGSQLVKGCESMKLTFTDVKNELHECGVLYEVCPTGAHYMHGKVERKIRSIKESFSKHLQREKLSIIEWETLGDTVANSINNLPIGLRSETRDLENVDLLTPNRLMLARNNSRCPVGPLKVTEDVDMIIKRNESLFSTWFQAWLVSHVPNLVFQPKWFRSDRDPKIGDVVLFLKSDKEFEMLYQYGMITDTKVSRDGKIRQLDIMYQNSNEKTKRFTTRGTREVVVIHHIDELGLIRELNVLASDT